MKYIGTYSNDADIATKAKVDAKQDKVLVNGILKGDGQGAISAAETQEVELVTLTKADVGLGNVDNTSDANKPISTATQTALNGKQATITGGAATITTSDLTANRALVSNADGKVAVSAVTSTELGYLDGVTSNIQTQLNGKLSTAPVTSVNSKTGNVELTSFDVKAQPFVMPIEIINNSYGFISQPTIRSLVEFYKPLDVDVLQKITLKATYFSPYTGKFNLEGSFTTDIVNNEHIITGAVFQGFGIVLNGSSSLESPTFDVVGAGVGCTLNNDGTETWREYVSLKQSIMPGVDVTASDNGKFLRVVNGAWAAATVENANGVSF